MMSKPGFFRKTKGGDDSSEDDTRLFLMREFFDGFYKVLWNLLKEFKEKKATPCHGYSLAFSACNDREGASTMALNFALAYAEASLQKVVLIDGNLRNPTLHGYFNVSRETGLTELLRSEKNVDQVLVEVEPSSFFFIPSGRSLQNPVVLYESAAFELVLQHLKDTFDVIIFDSSPASRSPETTVLASRMNGLIMVLEAESTRWEVARAARDSLAGTGANIVGAILNKKRYVIPEIIYRLL